MQYGSCTAGQHLNRQVSGSQTNYRSFYICESWTFIKCPTYNYICTLYIQITCKHSQNTALHLKHGSQVITHIRHANAHKMGFPHLSRSEGNNWILALFLVANWCSYIRYRLKRISFTFKQCFFLVFYMHLTYTFEISPLFISAIRLTYSPLE